MHIRNDRAGPGQVTVVSFRIVDVVGDRGDSLAWLLGRRPGFAVDTHIRTTYTPDQEYRWSSPSAILPAVIVRMRCRP